MKKIVIYPAVLLLGVTALHIIGCRGADNNLLRKAQIIVSENAQLEKQIENRDKEIAGLQQQIVGLQQQKDKNIDKLTQQHKRQIEEKNKHIADLQRQIKESGREKKQLQEKLENLPAQWHKDLQEQIREAGETNLSLLQMLADCLNQLQGGEPNDLPAEAGPNP